MKIDRQFLKNTFQFCASAALGLCGIALICLWPKLFDEFLTLKSNSFLYIFWHKIPVDIATDFHFFNWTNSEQFYNFSVKPRFEELGPYRFWQKEDKVNITWNENGTVTFQQLKFWHFENETESGNLDDVVITGNPVSIGASYIIRNWNYYIKKGIFITLSNSGILTLTIKKTARELLFDGYREPLIKIARALPFFSYMPAWERFGWLYNRNGSAEFDGVFNMGTGINNTILGKLYAWNYAPRTPYFEGSCANVVGSAGQLFPRVLRKDLISMYSSDLRRSFNFKFEKEEIVNNILGYKFTADKYNVDNGTIYPENKCFCNGECIPSGMTNISNTRFGIPIFASLPHYYQADPYYHNSVDGMKPDKEKHEMYLVIEPITGIPLKAHVGVQLNMLIQKNPGTKMFENVPRYLIPLIWAKQSYEIRGLIAFLVRLLVNFSTVCISIGSLMIITSIALSSVMIYKKYEHQMRKDSKERQFDEYQRIPLKVQAQEVT